MNPIVINICVREFDTIEIVRQDNIMDKGCIFWSIFDVVELYWINLSISVDMDIMGIAMITTRF